MIKQIAYLLVLLRITDTQLCTSKNASNAPAMHQHCSQMYQQCTSTAGKCTSNVLAIHQQFISNAPALQANVPAMHQHCTSTAPAMHQQCTSNVPALQANVPVPIYIHLLRPSRRAPIRTHVLSKYVMQCAKYTQAPAIVI